MRSALEPQNIAVQRAPTGVQTSVFANATPAANTTCANVLKVTVESLAQMRLLVRAHFDVLLGAGNDFIPVMLYEARSLKPHQRSALARLLIFGALNWSVQWFDRKKAASLDDLTDAAMGLFIQKIRN